VRARRNPINERKISPPIDSPRHEKWPVSTARPVGASLPISHWFFFIVNNNILNNIGTAEYARLTISPSLTATKAYPATYHGGTAPRHPPVNCSLPGRCKNTRPLYTRALGRKHGSSMRVLHSIQLILLLRCWRRPSKLSMMATENKEVVSRRAPTRSSTRQSTGALFSKVQKINRT